MDWNESDEVCVLYGTGGSMPPAGLLMEPVVIGHGEQDRIFFNHLDGELEKINRFYKAKESEYVSRAIRLEKQLLALFQVQEALARQSLKMRTYSFNRTHWHHHNAYSSHPSTCSSTKISLSQQ